MSPKEKEYILLAITTKALVIACEETKYDKEVKDVAKEITENDVVLWDFWSYTEDYIKRQEKTYKEELNKNYTFNVENFQDIQDLLLDYKSVSKLI